MQKFRLNIEGKDQLRLLHSISAAPVCKCSYGYWITIEIHVTKLGCLDALICKEINKRYLFPACSPNCVISGIQLNGFCCQSKGPVTSFIVLQEGTEVVINIWDWCRHTNTQILKFHSQRSCWCFLLGREQSYIFQSRQSSLQDLVHHPGEQAPDLPIPSYPWNTNQPGELSGCEFCKWHYLSCY